MRFPLAGGLEDRDAGVDLAQARARRDQQVIGQQPVQPGGVGVESSPLGAAHGRDEVIPWRMHEKDPLAHAPILPLVRALGCHGAGCEKATEHVVSLTAAKVWLVPGDLRAARRYGSEPVQEAQARGDGKSTAMPRTAIRACRRTITGRRGCPHIAADPARLDLQVSVTCREMLAIAV